MSRTNLSEILQQSSTDDVDRDRRESTDVVPFRKTVDGSRFPRVRTERRTKMNDAFYVISTMPLIILTWIQFAFNISIMMSLFFAAWKTIDILAGDLAKHMEKQSHLLLADMIKCSREYLANRCGMTDVPPAMQSMCDAWKSCLEQDTNSIMKSRETAVMLAEILNKFFDSLSDRTIYSCATLFITSVVLMNFMLSWSRLQSTKCRT